MGYPEPDVATVEAVETSIVRDDAGKINGLVVKRPSMHGEIMVSVNSIGSARGGEYRIETSIPRGQLTADDPNLPFIPNAETFEQATKNFPLNTPIIETAVIDRFGYNRRAVRAFTTKQTDKDSFTTIACDIVGKSKITSTDETRTVTYDEKTQIGTTHHTLSAVPDIEMQTVAQREVVLFPFRINQASFDLGNAQRGELRYSYLSDQPETPYFVDLETENPREAVQYQLLSGFFHTYGVTTTMAARSVLEDIVTDLESKKNTARQGRIDKKELGRLTQHVISFTIDQDVNAQTPPVHYVDADQAIAFFQKALDHLPAEPATE